MQSVDQAAVNDRTIKILEHPGFDARDFVNRWRKARLSAFRLAFAATEQTPAVGKPPYSPGEDAREETRLLGEALPSLHDKILKLVFDQSRKFAQGASRYFGVTLELDDFCEILPQSDIPCFQGSWRTHGSAKVLERKGCASLGVLGSFGCDYWREALDGLVMGAGETERIARHRSRGHGDSECLDVLYVEAGGSPNSPVHGGHEPGSFDKFGAIPDELGAALASVREKFEAKGIRLSLLGLSEGALYYRLDSKEFVLCGAVGALMHQEFRREVTRLCPGILLKDAAPLAVYGGRE